MSDLNKLFENNRLWSERIKAQNPEFFSSLAKQQSPDYLWIGCSDSRMPATQLIGLAPGELFVHRNVANIVVHTDVNCLSVLQFAVDVLKVEDVIVCGHYDCGGVKAALENQELGLIDNWLRHLQDVMHTHDAELQKIFYDKERSDRLCELNVIEQAMNLSRTTIVQSAWNRGQPLSVHGWIYGLEDGLLRDLKISISAPHEQAAVYKSAIRPHGQNG